MPVDPVAPSAVATSAWANSVSAAVTDLEADLYAAGQLAIPWAALTGKPAAFAPTAHQASHAAGGADVLPWATISGKPSSFTPTTHNSTHRYGDIDPVSAGNIGAVEARNTPSAVVTGTGRRLYVGTSTPTGATEGDIWIKG